MSSVTPSDSPYGMHAALRMNWTDEDLTTWEDRLKGSGTKSLLSSLKTYLPARLAEALITEMALPAKRIADLTKAERAALVQKLISYPLSCTGHEGYGKVNLVCMPLILPRIAFVLVLNRTANLLSQSIGTSTGQYQRGTPSLPFEGQSDCKLQDLFHLFRCLDNRNLS